MRFFHLKKQIARLVVVAPLCVLMIFCAPPFARAAETATPAAAEPPAYGLTGDWGGLRTKAEQAGLTFTGTHTLDWSDPWRGALTDRNVARGLLILQASLALAETGTTFTAEYLDFHGRDASADIGALMAYSNIDDTPFAHWGELSVAQVFFSGRLRLKLGQLDANTEFDCVHAAAEFLNASAGYSPPIVGFRTYPDPALSANVFVQATEQISIGLGVYGNTIRSSNTGFERPFVIGEVGFNSDALGRFAVGFTQENATLTRFDSTAQNGTHAFYALAERRIWQKNATAKDDLRGLTLFAQFCAASEAVSQMSRHFALGLSGTGLVPGRDEDICGLLGSVVVASRADPTLTAPTEAAFECFYGLRIASFLTLKADMQLIRHPGGQAARSDVLVGTLRLETTF